MMQQTLIGVDVAKGWLDIHTQNESHAG